MLRRLTVFVFSLGIIMALQANPSVNQTNDKAVQNNIEQTIKKETVPQNNLSATIPSSDLSKSDQNTPKISIHQELKKRFIEGGPLFMGIVLLCLIFGLAIAIERILFLSLSTTNTKKLNKELDQIFVTGGIEAAKEVCNNSRGAIARMYQESLGRFQKEGLEATEKALISHGGVQMGLLERNLSWISLCIALAPMLGFMGTVIGMIEAFDKIQAAGDMEPSLVAGGIKVALLTTVFGLVVAIILQVFYNYIVSKIDTMVNDMEQASIHLIDRLIDNQKNID